MKEPLNQAASQRKARRRFPALEKKRIVEQTYEIGSSISYVARQYGIAPRLLYKWRKALEEGALTGVECEDAVVSKKELKKLISRQPLVGLDDFE